MAATMPHVDDVDNRPVVCLCAGASIVQVKPLFSHDSKYLFCTCGNDVKVYSTESGECVRHLRAHTDKVTSLILNPSNKLQLMTCGLDRLVVFWDYADGVILKSYKFPVPLFGLISVWPKAGQLVFLVLQKSPVDANEGQLTRFILRNKDSSIYQTHNPNIFPSIHLDNKTMTIGAKGEYFAALSANQKHLLIHHNNKTVRYWNNVKLTCMAAHPTELCLATGTADGKIFYWYNFTNEKQMVKSVYHWHALEVINLAFSFEGSYLLSGGHENTLVKWQYETHYKDFLPRLGSAITHITTSADNRLYAVAHRDNGIHLITNTLRIQQIYQGMTHIDPDLGQPVGLLCDPRSQALITNGRPGHLQFYCVHTEKQLFNLDIVQQNYISPENLSRPLTVTQISKAAIDERGDWLVTYQEWDDGKMSPEMQLKFWLYDPASQNYVLNTAVDRPHEKSLHCLKLRPYTSVQSSSPPMTVSSGRDKKFKQWTLVDDTDIYRSNNKWTCDSVGFYRDMEAGKLAFAEDGSLLAVVFEASITLWDPDTNVLRTALSNTFNRKSIRDICFGRDSSCHLLVSTTEDHLFVWNLLTCAVQWNVSLHVSVLADDPLSKYMAVFTRQKELYVFEPSNTIPVFSKKKVAGSNVTSAVFVPQKEESASGHKGRLSWQKHSQLYYLTEQQELLTVQYEDMQDVESQKEKVSIKQSLPQSALSVLISKNKKSGGPKDKRTEKMDLSLTSKETQFVKQMLQASFVAQPPVVTLCQSFLETRLSKEISPNVPATEILEQEDIEEEEESHMNVEDSDSDSDMEVERSRSHTFQGKQEVSSEANIDDDIDALNSVFSTDYSWTKNIFEESLKST